MSDQKKNVFITGGSTGIGAASVRKFAQSGWNVTFIETREETCDFSRGRNRA